MFHRITAHVLAVLLTGVLGVAASGRTDASAVEPPVTVAETSDFARTGRYDDVQAFLAALSEQSPLIHLDSIGTTNEDRLIPLAILADPPVTSPQDVGNRLVVLLFGNIHAGEVCGKEALQMLARDIALGDEDRRAILKDLVICFVPIYNADGNERFSPTNRPGQVGPEEMGIRANAQGLDLNRDYVKLEAPETRALVRFFNTWDPAVVVDTHTTNGSRHRYTLTYQGPKHPAGDAAIIEYVRDTMLPAVDKAFEEKTGYHAFYYGNFAEQHTKWTTYPAQPRYGEGYLGVRNRLAILSEAYSYAPFADRVKATYAFCDEILRFSAVNARPIRDLIRAADRRTIDAGRQPDGSSLVSLDNKPEAFSDKVTVLGYIERDENGNRIESNEPFDYEVELINNFVSTLDVARPWAYTFPAEYEWLATLLGHHGIRVEVLREDIEVDIEAYSIDEHQKATRAFEGHHMVRTVSVSAAARSHRLMADSYIVRTSQKLGTLASILLEPQSTDGLVAWNFFDDALDSGSEFPVVRIPSRAYLTLRDARPLAEDRTMGRRLSYDDVHGSARLNLSGSAVSGLSWHDDEHFLQRKDGQLLKVHAVTGRAEPHELPPTDAVAESLAALPTIDSRTAADLARRHFARIDDSEAGQVFEHQGDLYFAKRDGSHAIRLTASPEREDFAQLSPDGQFVAFVRSNNLWVVDVMTATERAITTGGSDTLRHGRHCWLYFEELYSRNWRAFWWSPDSQHVAYFITDTAALPVFTIVDDNPRPHRVETERWSRPGEPNPHVEVAIASRAGGEPQRVNLSHYDHGSYLVSSIHWSKSTGRLRLTVQDRVQTWLDLLDVAHSGGEPVTLMRETTQAWVEPQGAPHELKDGSFILPSERDGYKHLYLFNKDASLKHRITEGPWEVRRVVHVDEDNAVIYFEGTADASTQIHFYRVNLDGSAMERLTPAGGSHRVQINPAGTYFIDTWSDIDIPTRVTLRDVSGTLVRTLDTNPVYELEEWDLGRIERVQVASAKGNDLEVRITYPPDFDPSRRYPIWFQTYAGPGAPSVTDSWSGGRLSDRLLAQLGIIAVQGDPYPASGKGAVSAWTAYKQLGVRELEDITEIITWITSHPWADSTRVGIAGHSYGGFMTAFAMTNSTLFSAGISGAPVTEWYEYDSIYTERYMLTPQMNPEGYRRTSAVRAAGNLSGRLLLLHGMMDDNVHLQNAVRLTDALVRADKQFEMFYYPGRRHGLSGRHYSRLVHDFILRTMTPELIVPAESSTHERDSESGLVDEPSPLGP
ncbi:MAG: DPP IV N-terminal domain-containing protein [Phycisphaeraceae bacterium]|nr:DPP IV N-terminal domain-containing protein [Phycisphaeraceae bacterium]